MARLTYAEAFKKGQLEPHALAAILAAAQNPDASEFSLPTETLVFNGLTFERLRRANVFKPLASTAITAGTGATIWTPASGKKVRLLGFWFVSSVLGQLIFGDNAVGTVIARSPALQAGVVPPPVEVGNGILLASANNVLKIDGPTGNVSGMAWGVEE